MRQMVDDVAAQFNHTTRRPEWDRFALPDEFFHIIGNPFNCIETAERVAKAMIGAKVITRLRFAISVLFSNFAPNFSLFKCLEYQSL